MSRIFVIDIDGPDAEAELRKLEAQYGPIPPTVESITARGRHLFFHYPEQPVRNSAGKLAPGIDVRGDGGYVLAPPSKHPSGRRYCWSVDSANAFAPAPEWLLAMLAASAAGNGNVTLAPAEWRDLVCGGVDEGQRNETRRPSCWLSAASPGRSGRRTGNAQRMEHSSLSAAARGRRD